MNKLTGMPKGLIAILTAEAIVVIAIKIYLK
jgi:hypothetical protein